MNVRIFGDGLDALILSATLSELKINYTWYQTSDYIGGYFRGALDCQNRPLDLGMVLLEPNDYGARRTGIIEFAGESGIEARGFLSDAYSYIKGKFGTTSPVRITTLNNELLEFPDYFISDHLDAFLNFPSSDQLELRERVEWTISNPRWHPREKHSNPEPFTNIGLEKYIILILGQNFYNEYFRSFMTNLLGEKKNHLNAYLHRKVWMPVYWPETICNLLAGVQQVTPLFNPVFARPEQGSVASFVALMSKKVSKDPRATLLKLPAIDPAQFGYFSSKYDFAFIPKQKLSPNSGFEIKPQQEKITLRLVHFCTENQKNSVYFLNSQHDICFRYSTFSAQDDYDGAVMFEYGELSENIPDMDLIKLARALAAKRNIKLNCQGKVFNGSLPLSQNSAQFAEEISIEIPNKFTVHNASAITINDHILRGTCAASRIESLIK